MKLILLMTAFVLVSSSDVTKEEWEAYKKEHNKRYNEAEDKKRLEMYKEGKRIVEEHNKGKSSYKMGINYYTDMYESELMKLLDQPPKGPRPEGKPYRKAPGDKPPESINWVTKGAVTKIKDQRLCGGSYAFAAAAALEGLMFRAKQTITDLSVQELLDCDTNNFQCISGYVDYSYDYVKKNGISTAASYPFTGEPEKCKTDGKINATTCGGYMKINNETSLTDAVGLIGPAAFVFSMNPRKFFPYKSGIYDDGCGVRPNHAMVAVGYDKDKTTGTEYWLVKNSWSEKWGEKGFARIIRNKNLCGLADIATIPTIANN